MRHPGAGLLARTELFALQTRSAELVEERKLRQHLMGRVQDIVYVLDAREDKLLFVSNEIALLLGHNWSYIRSWGETLFTAIMHPEDLAQRPFFLARLSSLRDGETLERQFRLRDACGQWRWLRSREIILDRTQRDQPLRVMGIAEDITSRKRDEDRLKEMALVDPLTGLRNRRGFLAISEQYVKIAKRQGRKFTVLFIDMDHFKSINDTFGHEEGDHALRLAAEVLRKTLRTSDILCRYGGDEFAALAVDVETEKTSLLIARIRKSVEKLNPTGSRYRIDFSIGCASCDPAVSAGDVEIADAIRLADEAMYRDKAARRARETPPNDVFQ